MLAIKLALAVVLIECSMIIALAFMMGLVVL